MTWYTPWWAETGSPFLVGCRCTEEDPSRRAWTQASDGTYVHQCGNPSLATIRSQDLLNIFQGGPKHNFIVETHDLIHDRTIEVGGWLLSYKWTPETITGSATGRVARVWRWEEPSRED